MGKDYEFTGLLSTKRINEGQKKGHVEITWPFKILLVTAYSAAESPSESALSRETI